ELTALRQTGILLKSSHRTLRGRSPLAIDGTGVISPVVQRLLDAPDEVRIVLDRWRRDVRRRRSRVPFFASRFVTHVGATNAAYDRAHGSAHHGTCDGAACPSGDCTLSVVHSVPSRTTAQRGCDRECDRALRNVE